MIMTEKEFFQEREKNVVLLFSNYKLFNHLCGNSYDIAFMDIIPIEQLRIGYEDDIRQTKSFIEIEDLIKEIFEGLKKE